MLPNAPSRERTPAPPPPRTARHFATTRDLSHSPIMTSHDVDRVIDDVLSDARRPAHA